LIDVRHGPPERFEISFSEHFWLRIFAARRW
jgi:hypothetical protein